MTTTFESLGVPAPIVRALTAEGKTEPFPIQAATLPDTLDGADVLGRGKTGSGKTLAFSIPLVAGLAELAVDRKAGAPTGLVLAPTRELATQIAATVTPLAEAAGLVVTTIFGGVKQARQEAALRRGADIVVACPGRLDDLMRQGIVRLDSVEITVLDEADHMADLGFLPVVTKIMAATPADGQRLLFSATLDNGVDKLVRRFLDDPTVHSVDEENSPVAQMTHHVFEVADTGQKTELVQTLASGVGRRILFTRTKHQARKWARKLTADGIPAVDLHGNLSQPQRDRNLAAFGDGSVRVLVATDIAARGVHVDDVALVVHVDPPAEHKAYLHRSGRTARAGSAGDVVTICQPDQRKDLNGLLRKAGISVRPEQVTAGSASVGALVGERAPHVAPSAPAPASSGSGGSRRPGGGRAGGRGPARGTGQGGSGRAFAVRCRASRTRTERFGRGGAAQGAGRSAQGGSGRDGSARTGGGRSGASRGGASRSEHTGARRGGGQNRSGGRRSEAQGARSGR
ncbi:DEAD/DEAH box helicase [Gordonia soli]|uniref:Putative ATP-dependent RNA helicase n=1 Tax=Gordonia soli NBRC 108243 TaxID=1223545 RepID=M0QD49_9ACTN|nr:DEAD/DEAH box helicase [Gordonia soli]GAC66490.1 putative ATP-dependent RNA helicase [Gordonia soli NBRC 108243]